MIEAPGRWLTIKIGCLECGLGTEIIGTFDTEDAAHDAALIKPDDYEDYKIKVFDLLAA